MPDVILRELHLSEVKPRLDFQVFTVYSQSLGGVAATLE
jgi:hypothetical protein